MKKKEIMKLLEYRKNLLESEYGKKLGYYGTTDELGCPLKGMYPDIKELENEFSILDNEFERLREKRRKSELYVENNKDEVSKIECNHPVLFGFRGTFGYYHYCAFCNKEVRETDNKVRLLSGGCDEEDEEEVLSKKEKRELYNRFYAAITVMLRDYSDEEEIDFTKTFHNGYEVYNIGKVEINIPIKEYNILIISGSNKINLSDNYYLKKEVTFDESIVEHIDKLCNCNINQITSLKSVKKGYKLYYETMDELNETLKEVSNWNTKMDIVIDYSDLINYEIVNNEIKVSKESLDLKTFFPNSTIIFINSISDEINLYEKLRNSIIEEKGLRKKR